MLEQKNILLLNVEPELDCADPRSALKALKDAQFVVSLTPWKTNVEYADVLLPIAPFTETSGTFVNTEGRVQSFYANVNPLGDTRPGWKVLRVLGSLLGKPGFDFDTIEQVRKECLGERDVASLLSNTDQWSWTRSLHPRAEFKESPTCRCTSPTRWCAARRRCRRRGMRVRRAPG